MPVQTPYDGLSEGASAIGYLTTVGRVTGQPHRVALRLVRLDGKLYVSRRDAASDWCRNLLREPAVAVEIGGVTLRGTARQVESEALLARVSAMKYTDGRTSRGRIVVEISPCEQSDEAAPV